jgi:hypothetical protein
MRKLPPESTLIDFIMATHSCDKIQLSQDDMKNTLSGKGKISPYIQGHRKALKFICTELVGSSDFPAKSPQILINHYHSDNSLYWLKEIHSLILYPIATDNISSMENIRISDCGNYRYKSKLMAFDMAPQPEDILPLLHLWLKEASELNDEVKDNIDNPYGITQEQSKKLVHFVNEITMFFSCLQPFEEGTNRVARIVENTFRLHWYMPWFTQHPGSSYDEYIRKFTNYQQNRWKNYWIKNYKQLT